uniref:Uncharacterized protein n=1 Tax=viral metagenome TaxID=1070528 RepID=A0A6H1ZSP4_9ZZZZ
MGDDFWTAVRISVLEGELTAALGRADQAEAERDDTKRRLCAEMALRLQGGAVPHATPHSVAHGQFGLVEADRLFPRQAQEGGE